jgi:hypothetical protein
VIFAELPVVIALIDRSCCQGSLDHVGHRGDHLNANG